MNNERVTSLRGRVWAFQTHHIQVPERQSEFLVGMALGLSNTELGKQLCVSDETIHRHSADVRRRVVPAEFEATRANAQFWAMLHRNCCLATAFAGMW